MADSYNIKDPLIIVANGPSVTKDNLEAVRNYDTFGMKGAYRLYPKLNWWPKYWGYFDTRWVQNISRFGEVQNLITGNNPIEHIFLFDCDIDRFEKSDKVTFLRLAQEGWIKDKKITYDEYKIRDKFIKAFMRLEKVDKNQAMITFYNLFEKYQPPEGYFYNYSAYLKIYYKRSVRKEDMICPGFRYLKPSPDKSFDNFFCPPGSSALVACRIGVSLGYKKILLLGVDLNYDPTDKKNYWNDDICDPEDPIMVDKEIYMKVRSTAVPGVDTWEEYLDIVTRERNEYLFKKFKYSNPNVEIVNCNPNSKLECFPKIKLEDALNV